MFALHFCGRNQLLEFDRGYLNAFLADEMTHSARRIITLIVDAIIHCVDLFDWFPENIKCIITYVGVSQKMGCSCRVKMTLKFVAEKLHPFYTKSGLFVD